MKFRPAVSTVNLNFRGTVNAFMQTVQSFFIFFKNLTESPSSSFKMLFSITFTVLSNKSLVTFNVKIGTLFLYTIYIAYFPSTSFRFEKSSPLPRDDVCFPVANVAGPKRT